MNIDPYTRETFAHRLERLVKLERDYIEQNLGIIQAADISSWGGIPLLRRCIDATVDDLSDQGGAGLAQDILKEARRR